MLVVVMLPLLFQLCALSIFCFSVASCLYSLILVYNKKPEAIFWLFISVTLLSVTGFFMHFSLNVGTVLFHFTGLYFGILTVAIVLYYKQCKSSVSSYLLYVICLCFMSFNVATRLSAWSMVLKKSLIFFNHSMSTYNALLDEANTCFCIALGELSTFLNYQSFFDISELLTLGCLVLLSYSLVTYNLSSTVESKVLINSVQTSVFLLMVFIVNGTIVIGPTALCAGGKAEAPTSAEAITFSEMLVLAGKGTSAQIAEWRDNLVNTVALVKKATKQSVQNVADLDVLALQKDVHSIASSTKILAQEAERISDPLYQIITGLTLGASGMVGALVIWHLYKHALAFKKAKITAADDSASADVDGNTVKAISKDSSIKDYVNNFGKYSTKSKALSQNGFELYNPTCYAGPFVKGSTIGAFFNKAVMTLTKGF